MYFLKNQTFSNKVVILRVDLNVPFNEKMEVTDKTRIESVIPTLKHLLKYNNKVILMTHLGRPKGQVQEKYSLKHIVKDCEKTWGISVLLNDKPINEIKKSDTLSLKENQVMLLENIRFYPEEEKGDENFSKTLANLADIYVNDAFGTAHRAHASTTVIAKHSKEKFFGYLMGQEIEAIEKVLKNQEKPVLAIIGGSKVSTKVPIIKNLLPKVDTMLIGGGMSFTFVKATGGNIGKSLCEDDQLDLALEILEEAKKHNTEIILPIDVTAADDFANDAKTQNIEIKNIPDDWMGLDAGQKSIETFGSAILKSKTILWNGPLGVFEMPTFAKGTLAVGNAIVEATKKGSFSLVGGGDSVAAVKQYGLEDKVSYVSTGGGAMLEALEGKVLPGIAAIYQK